MKTTKEMIEAAAVTKKLENEILDLKEKISWKPIETAPKDGTEILVLEAGGIYIARWVSPFMYNGYWSYDGWEELEDQNSPDYWMELPQEIPT